MKKSCVKCVFNPYAKQFKPFLERFEMHETFCKSIDFNFIIIGGKYCENFLPKRKYRNEVFGDE